MQIQGLLHEQHIVKDVSKKQEGNLLYIHHLHEVETLIVIF